MTAAHTNNIAAQAAPETTSEQAAAPSDSSTLVDYRATILRLEKRAAAARRRVKLVGLSLGFGVVMIATLIFAAIMAKEVASSGRIWPSSIKSAVQALAALDRTASNPSPSASSAPSSPSAPDVNKFSFEPAFELFRNRSDDTAALLGRRVRSIVNRLEGRNQLDYISVKNKNYQAPPPLTPQETQRLRVELKEALDDLERAVKIEAQRRPDPISSQLTSITSTVVFSVGAMVFVYLLIQIAIMFIRYHTRLAELYDAQADALRAAGGDAALAYGFLQHFSPNSIELGATPTTLYEKALDAVKEIATAKKT